MSGNKQKTIADIVAEMRNEGHAGDASCLEWIGAKIRGYADRIEAAYRREVAIISNDRDEMYKSEQETVAKTKAWFEEYQNLKREVAELRECLKETMADAVAEYKNNSCFRNVKCGEIERCDTCKVMRWRKALKGASND